MMDSSLLDDFDDRVWKQHAKVNLELEIERGYQNVKDFPIVEGSLEQKSHEYKIRTRRKELL